MNRIFALAASAALLGTATVADAAFTNGSFEQLAGGQGYPPSNGFNEYGANNVSGDPIVGWTITAGSIDYIGPDFWQPSAGSYSLDMNGADAATLTQTFDTVAGQAYLVSFDLSKNYTNPSFAVLRVSAGATPFEDYTFSAANTAANMMWSTRSYAFTAADVSTTLTFASLTGGNAGPALDNVSVAAAVAAVPEPASWGMMILGMGLAGAALRRRRASPAAADRRVGRKIAGALA